MKGRFRVLHTRLTISAHAEVSKHEGPSSSFEKGGDRGISR